MLLRTKSQRTKWKTFTKELFDHNIFYKNIRYIQEISSVNLLQKLVKLSP